MQFNDDILLLSRVPFFKGFGEEHLKLLAFGSESARYADGACVYTAGATTEKAFLVKSGRLKLKRPGCDAAIDFVETGEMLGARALLTPSVRPSSAFADGETILLRIRRSIMQRIMGEYPELAQLLYQRAERTMDHFHQEMDSVVQHLRKDL